MLMDTLTTKEKILTAAKILFVEHGFAGTSIGNIAKLANVNHSLIFHHFHNKDPLWVAVKLNIVEKSKQKETLPPRTLPFKQFLKKLFAKNFQFYQENPDLIRMINWQRMLGETEQKIGVTDSSQMKNWIAVFKHYQTQGDVNAKLKPEFIITLILSVISSAALDPNVYIYGKKNKQAYLDFFLQQILKGLG
jgi:AcrR family transcriptional regulator